MKKHLLYAALFVGALSSCSKDDDRVSTPAGEVNNDLEEIKLAVTGAEAFNVQTRGTGMVGGLAGENSWNGQTLYVLMTDSGTVNKVASANAGYEYENMPTEILWNVAVKAPANGESGAITGPESTSGVHYYYPIKGNFDFYGYHVDDAAFTMETTTTGEGDAAQTTTQKKSSELTVSGNDLTLDVTIDGSQDLLVAKADWTTDLGTKGSEFYPNAGGYKYGAYAARRGVHPTLKFQHLLTQLQFTVENESEDNAITVTSINVTSKNTATMTVAGENFGTIAWNATTAKLAVQDKKEMVADDENIGQFNEVKTETMNALDPVILNVSDPATEIGNLLVAASGEDAPITMYVGEITLQQTLDATLAGNSLDTDVVVEQTVPFNIALPATSVHPNFLAGHAYNVKIYVYGLSLIKVTAELTAWEDGGSFEVTPEDQVNTGESATFEPTDEDKIAAFENDSKNLYKAFTDPENDFDDKGDALLAYLASGYSVASITRAENAFVYNPAAEGCGEIDFTPYATAATTVEGTTTYNVTITSVLTAKIEYQENVKNGWVVRDRKTWEMLPSSYRKNYDGYPEPENMPWLAVTYTNLEADKVTVITPSGVTVELTGDDWSVATTNTLTTVNAAELKAVKSELPETLEDGVYTITIGTSTWEIEYKGE